MENQPDSGLEVSQPIEQVATPEIQSAPPLDSLPESLGFVETAEMGEVRGQLVEAMSTNSDSVRELATRYQVLGEAVVEQHRDDEFSRAQLGLQIQMALIRRDAGRIDYYIEDLDDALTVAGHSGLADAVTAMRTAIEELRGSQEWGPTPEQLSEACSDVLTPEDCAELAAMPTAELAWGYAYTLLIENGVEDPDEFLRSKGMEE